MIRHRNRLPGAVGLFVAYRAVRRRHADRLQARRLRSAVQRDMRIRAKIKSLVNITDAIVGCIRATAAAVLAFPT